MGRESEVISPVLLELCSDVQSTRPEQVIPHHPIHFILEHPLVKRLDVEPVGRGKG